MTKTTRIDYNKTADQLVEQWLDWALQTHPPSPTRCECDEEAWAPDEARSLYNPETEWPYVTHAPGMCECTNDLRLCKRNGKTVWLCSNCRMSEDEEVDISSDGGDVKRHEFYHHLPPKPVDQRNVYVLIHEDPYDKGDKVYGVFTSKRLAEQYMQDYVNDHEGEGGDDFRVVQYTLDRLYTE